MFYFYFFPLLFEPELEWCCINKTSLLYLHIVLEDLVRPFQNPTLLSFNGLSWPFNFFPKCSGTINFLVSKNTTSKCLPGLASDSMAFLFSKYYSIHSILIFFLGIFFLVLVDYTRSLDLQPNRKLLIVPQGGVGKFHAIPHKDGMPMGQHKKMPTSKQDPWKWVCALHHSKGCGREWRQTWGWSC